MQNVETSQITIVLGGKSGVAKSLIAAAFTELIATEPSAAGRGDIRMMSGLKPTVALSGPRRRRTKNRRD